MSRTRLLWRVRWHRQGWAPGRTRSRVFEGRADAESLFGFIVDAPSPPHWGEVLWAELSSATAPDEWQTADTFGTDEDRLER